MPALRGARAAEWSGGNVHAGGCTHGAVAVLGRDGEAVGQLRGGLRRGRGALARERGQARERLVERRLRGRVPEHLHQAAAARRGRGPRRLRRQALGRRERGRGRGQRGTAARRTQEGRGRTPKSLLGHTRLAAEERRQPRLRSRAGRREETYANCRRGEHPGPRARARTQRFFEQNPAADSSAAAVADALRATRCSRV